MTRITVGRTSCLHMGSSSTIRACSSTWVRRSLPHLLSRSPEYWLHHLGREKTLSAALQLQHDAGLILSNVHVLQQLVTALNRTSSEVMRVVHGRRPFPTDVMQQVVPSYRVRRAAHYMAAMGLWRPPTTQEVRGPLPLATCNACMSCTWDLGVADSQVLTVCYDCLCLISLFRTVMSLYYDWDDVFVWTGHDEEYDRSPGWELRYLPHLYAPLVVDRVTEYLTEIKVPGWSPALSGDMYTGAWRCVSTRGTPLGVFSAGRISLTLIGRRTSVGGSVGCSDWSCVDCAVDISPGGVWIDYIRPGLEDGTLIDAAPVTGPLVSSTLFSCRDVFCTARFSSNWTFCGTDWVLPVGYQVYLHWIA